MKTIYTTMPVMISLLLTGYQGYAYNSSPDPILEGVATIDSTLPQNQYVYENEVGVADIIDIETDFAKNRDNRKTFARLLKVMKLKKMTRNNSVQSKLFSDLAFITARLRLYPLAMKFYSQSLSLNANVPVAGDTALFSELSDTDSLGWTNEWAAGKKLKTADDVTSESEPVSLASILESFDDHRPASGYALLLHVKQPVPGKRSSFSGISNVGHMFITLVKYNKDHTAVSRSFGFYPAKNSTFSATPLDPSSPSTYKDDSRHDWDESIGRFISRRRFSKILRLLKGYEDKTYDLNGNNCTDFGLTIANIGGIRIEDTHGKWFLGDGNTPADAGQSILEGKITNTDGNNRDELFICPGTAITNF